MAYPRSIRTAGFLVACVLWSGGSVAAQIDEVEDDARIERVEIRGVEGTSVSDLAGSLVTRPTRCRSIFLKPLCWISPSGTFVERHNLDLAEIPRDELRIRVHLWRRGWRQATVATQVTPHGNGVAVVFDVDQGPAIRLRDVAVRQTEPVLDNRALRRASFPEAGDRVDLIAFDTARARLYTTLGQRGYADATVRDTILIEDSVWARAEVLIDPGSRTTIAAIEIEGNERVTDDVIKDALPIRVGRLYRASDVAEAQRTLYLTGMFSEAIVRVAPEADSAKTILVTVNEAPFSLVRASVGATTADYVQAQGQFTRYNWMGGGRRLDLSGTIGRLLAGQLDGAFPFEEVRRTDLPGASDDAFLRPTWQVSAQVIQPAFPVAASSVGFGLFSHRRVEPGVVVDRGFGATATFTRSLGRRAPISLLYRYELNTVLAGDIYFCVSYGVCDRPTIDALQSRQSLSPLGISGFVDQVDDALTRGSGYTIRYGLEHASDITLSDFAYNRADVEIARDFRVGGGTLAARLHGGWVRAAGGGGEGDELDRGARLHPTKRFYAGGARSTRGFGENQLGPRILTIGLDRLLDVQDDAPAACVIEEVVARTCDPGPISSIEFTPRPVGGTRLIEFGLEYRRPLWNQLVGAVFVDAARVDDPALESLADARSAVTPGFGVRYQSPIGPVRVDIGFHPASTEDLAVITNVEEGGVTRLIRLENPKRYDPTEGREGFLSALTNRMTLHLSIGESF